MDTTSQLIELKLSKLELQALDTYAIIMQSSSSSNKEKREAADAIMEIRGKKNVKVKDTPVSNPVQINFNIDALNALRTGMKSISKSLSEVEDEGEEEGKGRGKGKDRIGNVIP